MMDDFARGMKEGIAWSVAWLHKRADWMNDPLAKAVLNGAAFSLGREKSQAQIAGHPAPDQSDVKQDGCT